jgi:peptidyl-prolyl cis-trans isomerase SurA
MEKLNLNRQLKYMMKKTIIALVLLTGSVTTFAQTLFTYGNNTVSKDEFLRAYNKNKTESTDKEKALREYLELYTRFKLKVKAAQDMRLDTLPQLASDLQNFRSQIEESYMNNDEALEALVTEAYANSKKDLYIQHFFAAFNDTTKADERMKQLYLELNSGKKDYNKLAAAYGAVTTDVGYITTFTLPYEYEKIIYGLKPGSVSQPYKGKRGWHIFKVVGERVNPGRWKVAQILLAIPPGDSATNVNMQLRAADSIYAKLKAGADFGALAKELSNDKLTYLTGGEMPEFTTGRYEQQFENEVFKIKKDGDIAMPFVTSFGVHIVKRLSVRMNVADKNDAAYQYDIRQRVQQDARAGLAKELFTQSVLKKVVYKRNAAVKDKDLFRFADSVVADPAKYAQKKFAINKTPVFSFGKNILTGADWLYFVREFKTNPELYKGESNAAMLQKFVTSKSLEYYRTHLDEYNTAFRSQLEEFKEGNLLFEVMERKVWSNASADTAGLRRYYNNNNGKYVWAASADVIVFNAGNKKAADSALAALQQGKNWKAIAEESNNELQADSGRYEISQITTVDNGTLKAGMFTPIAVNPADGTAGFLKIVKLYPAGLRRSFDEARGLVINDYQIVLEEKWIDELKKKYPVKIEENVFKALLQ